MTKKNGLIAKTAHWIFMSCAQATLSMEKESAQQLAGWEQWRLRGHLRICQWCRAYAAKAKKLDTILDKHLRDIEVDKLEDADLQSFKERLREKLKK
ncbi:hypothetical protein [Sphingobacterium sp. MYb382]|uniref:hypothetical protein n=1 Tax=Sphingobacterium sp. MYb382 TaxID=2745278 RepID=UPI0030B1734A